MVNWLYPIISVIIVSLMSFVGILFLLVKLKSLKKILLLLVSFSAGSLFGGSFLHLIPESVEKSGLSLWLSLNLVAGILAFFVLEKIVHWRHCHIPTSSTHPHPFVYMNLVGDGCHNFIDGAMIAGSFIVSIPLGIATTLAIVLHEIPQEIGDFGVLIHGGFSIAKALFMNFISALAAVVGTVTTLFVAPHISGLVTFLLPFTAGGFIYIAGSDLIPELHKETAVSKSVLQLVFIIAGIVVMLLVR